MVFFDILINFSKEGDEEEEGGGPVCVNGNPHHTRTPICACSGMILEVCTVPEGLVLTVEPAILL